MPSETATEKRSTATKTTRAMTRTATNPEPKVEPGRSLADIAKEIMANYQDLTDAFKAFTRDNTPRYLSMGTCLNEAKKQLGHGPFTHWVVENFPFTPQHARNCMRIVDNWTMLQPKFENENRFSFSLANEYVRELKGKPAPRLQVNPPKTLTFDSKPVVAATSISAPVGQSLNAATLQEIATALCEFVDSQVTNVVSNFSPANTNGSTSELVRNTVWKTVREEATKHLRVQGSRAA
jgi:hypothetical protein